MSSPLRHDVSNIVDIMSEIDYTISGGDGVPKNLRLKAARASKDMSQKDLAESVGVTRQTINAIESGDYNPTIRLCMAICRVLGRTLDDIFWEVGGDA